MAPLIVMASQHALDERSLPMIRTLGPLGHLQRLLKQRLRLVHSSLALKDRRQASQSDRDVAVLRIVSGGALNDIEMETAPGLGLAKPVLRKQELREHQRCRRRRRVR